MQAIEESIKLFKESWATYQKIIHNNYMFHGEIGRSVGDFLSGFFGGRAIRLMDFGCGDASQTLAAFSLCNLDFYQGCDVSRVALDLAGQNLVRAGIPHVLQHKDMLQCAATPGPAFDVMFASFAMHHLDLAQKAVFLKELRACLKPRGLLVLVDLALDVNEDRAAYLANYLGHVEDNWSELDPREKASIRDHVSSHDFPERLSTYDQLAMDAGFSEKEHLCQHTWHHAFVYKNA
jgi:SAM-dependent methyltransferase